MSRTTLLPLLAAALLAALATPVRAADESPVVHVYSARHYDVDQKLYDDFQAATGIEVKVIEGKDDALLARLEAEGKRSPCDVFITVDAARLQLAEQAELFQPIESELLETRIPAHLRHPDGLWFGLSTRARCIVYNTDAVQPEELSTYEALAGPEWKGRVLIRSSSNVYNQSLVGSLIANHGVEKTEAWAQGLVANMARPPQGGDTDQIRAVAAGEGDVAVVNSYYFARLAKSTRPEDRAVVEKVAIYFPNQGDRGTHVNVSGAGIVKTSPNKEAAVRFLEYLASPAAQALFARGNNEFPVAADVELDPVLASWSLYKLDTTTPVAEFGRLNRDAVMLMDRAGWR